MNTYNFGSNFICLVREDIEPFGSGIQFFINKADYENALIPAEVLCHENIPFLKNILLTYSYWRE